MANSDHYRITPFLGLAHDRITRGAFSEKEAPDGLQANSANYAQTAGSVGLRFTQRFSWLDTSWIEAYGLYQISLKATPLSYRARFTGLPSLNFLIEGINLPKHSAWVGIGLNIQWTSLVAKGGAQKGYRFLSLSK